MKCMQDKREVAGRCSALLLDLQRLQSALRKSLGCLASQSALGASSQRLAFLLRCPMRVAPLNSVPREISRKTCCDCQSESRTTRISLRTLKFNLPLDEFA